MRHRKAGPIMVAAALCLSCHAAAQRVPVPNPSLEVGADTPIGWALPAGRGEWLDGNAADGQRAVAVTGNGQWQAFEQTVTKFPQNARSVRLNLQATRWRDDGALKGAVWFDEPAPIEEQRHRVARAIERLSRL